MVGLPLRGWGELGVAVVRIGASVGESVGDGGGDCGCGGGSGWWWLWLWE